MAGFAEDASVHLEPSEDGVVTIGDLWDVGTSKSVGYNLFGPLTDKHVIAYPLQDSHYTMDQVKTFSDIIKALSFGVEFDVSLSPIFSVGGGVAFASKEGKKLGDDEIICACRKDYFSVRTLKEINNNIDESIRSKLQSGSLKATHVVTEVITGGKLSAKITVKDEGPQSRLYIKGSIRGTIDVVVASASVGVSLWIENLGDGMDTTIDIKVDSYPPVKTQPKNLRELLQMVNQFNAQDEKCFKMIQNPDVSGVPVRFKLVPVSVFLASNSSEMEIPREKVFKVIDDELLESLFFMFATLKDFQIYEYIKERVLETDSRLKTMLMDSENELTMEITEKENHFKALSLKFQGRAHRVLFDYKVGLRDTTALKELLAEFEQEFDLCKIHEDVLEYAQKGRRQLLDVKSFDFNPEENAVTFFTNTQYLQDWLESSKSAMKIVLQTKGEEGTTLNSYGAFLTLFDLSKSLQEIGIQVGILYPNVSSEFSLQFISSGLSLVESEKKFVGNQVTFAVNILRIAIGKGYSVETKFHTALAALNSINLPLKSENLIDMTSLVATTMDFRSVKVCDTFLQLRALMAKDDKWKFVVTVDVADTLIEGLTCFKRLKTFFKENLPNLDYELIVGTFGDQIIEQRFAAAPVILAFKNNSCKAVCMDNLDLQVLLQEFSARKSNLTSNTDPDLETLSLKSMTPVCLYPERSKFAAAVAILWGDREFSLINYSYGSFTRPVDQIVVLTLELIRAAVSEDYGQIAAAGAKICLTYTELKNFLNVLKKYKWDEMKQAFMMNSAQDWRNLYAELRNYFYSNDAFLSKLDYAVTALEEYVSDKDSYDSIQNLIEDEECPLELRLQLEDLLVQPYEKETDRVIDLVDAMTLYIDQLQSQITFQDVHGEEKEDYVAKYNNVLRKLEECVSEMKRRLNSANLKPDYIIDDVIKASKEYGKDIEHDLIPFKDALPNVYIQAALKVFEQSKREITSKNQFQHLAILTDYTDKLASEESEKPSPDFLADIITRYILVINDKCYPGTWPKAVSFVKRNSFYQVLDVLSKSLVHPALKNLFIHFDIITGTAQEALLVKIIETLGNYELTTYNYTDLWENPKFLQLMEPGIKSPVLLNTIKHFQCQSTTDNLIANYVPDFVPPAFSKEIKALGVADHIHFEFNKVWNDVFDFLHVLQVISIRARFPASFHQTLWENITRNTALKETLARFQVLFYWNEAGQYFDEPWDLSTVRTAAKAIKEWIQKDIDNSTTVTELGLIIKSEDFEQDSSDEEPSEEVELDHKWDKLTGGSLKLLAKSNLYQFIEPLQKPKVAEEEMTTFMAQIIPYVLQQLQHLDFKAMTPKNISECVEKLRDQFEPERPGNIPLLDSDDEDEENPPISRLDVLTCIFTAMDTNLSLWLLATLNRFPSPLPFIIPNITLNPTNDFKCLLPWLKTLTSTGNGLSTLFSDPYKLIVCVRIGARNDDEDKGGKSSILNTILKPEHMFSSKNEPGSNTGKPYSLPGFVEFVELTNNSCHSDVWPSVQDENQSGYPILLANVHGDIFHYPETLDLLSKLATSFLVFHNRDNWTHTKETARQFKDKIKYPMSKNTIHLMVDPDPTGDVFDKVKESDKINLGEKPETVVEKLKNLLVGCVSFDAVRKEQIPETYSFKYESIEMTGNVETSLSSKIIKYCTDSSCKLVKDILVLHNKYPLTVPDFNRIWRESADLREIISLFASITLLPISRRRIAYSHLSTRLSQLAFWETRVLRQISDALSPLLEKEINADRLNFDAERFVNLQKYSRQVQIRQQDHRLITMQNFFNEIMAIYEFYDQPDPAEAIVSPWPEVYAHFFHDGNPIDLSCRKYPKWTDNFFLSIMNLEKSLKLFVVSVLGPAGSGKSRLLNDIFGTQFPTRPQAKTQGISLSLIHLHESSKSSIANDVDALLILDTEGLCSLDTIADHEAETEQRKMVATVLSLSHMIIFNVNGTKKGCVKYMRNLPDENSDMMIPGNLLELPLIAMTRLGTNPILDIVNSLDISEVPKEIFLVHHSDVDDTEETEEAISVETNVEQLKLAFEVAASVSNSANVEIGRDNKINDLFPTLFQKDLDFDTISFVLGKVDKEDGNYDKNISFIRDKITNVLKTTTKFPTIIEWFNFSQMTQKWFSNEEYENSIFPCGLNSIKQLQMYNDIRTGILNDFKSAVEAALEDHRKKIENDIEAVENVDDFAFILEKVTRFLGSCDLDYEGEFLKTPCSFCKKAIVLSSHVKIEAKKLIGETGLENSVDMYLIRQADYHRRYGSQLIAGARLVKNRVVNSAFPTEIVYYIIPWEMKYILKEKIRIDLANREHAFKTKELILEESWYILNQLVANQVQMISLSRFLTAEAEEEYKHACHLVLPNLWQVKNLRSGDSVVIFDIEDKPTFSDNWEKDEWLHMQLQGMLKLIFKESDDANIFRIGMIRKLKEKIDDSVEQFQIRHKSEIDSEERWKVHTRGLGLFYQHALNAIKQWNESTKNNPLIHIRLNEEKYKLDLNNLYDDLLFGKDPVKPEPKTSGSL